MFLYRMAWAHAVLYVQMQPSRNLITEMKQIDSFGFIQEIKVHSKQFCSV